MRQIVAVPACRQAGVRAHCDNLDIFQRFLRYSASTCNLLLFSCRHIVPRRKNPLFFLLVMDVPVLLRDQPCEEEHEFGLEEPENLERPESERVALEPDALVEHG